MSWRVYGAYETEEDAVVEVDFLTCCGYDKKDIKIVGKNRFKVEVRSVEELYAWQGTRDGFTYDKWKEDDIRFNEDVKGLSFYRDEFIAGFYLLLINEDKIAKESVLADVPVPKMRQNSYL